ncbi:hypothetical protein BDD12DRAFT_789257 [Trichophaea hybrida]|nr:hypothetical protein BDD12DRAFT_789257 [Trichophaea hybrida]
MVPAPQPAHGDRRWDTTMPSNFNQPGYVVEYRGHALLVTELVMISVTLLIVGLRLYTRLHILGAIHSDDWWILLATGVLISLTAVHGVGVRNGIGKHIYDITIDESNIALTMSYIGQILYVASLACVKISLLLFLQRIFPSVVMRRVLRGLLIFVLCFSVTNIYLFAFQCDTPEYYFSTIKATESKNGGVCLAPQVVYYPMAAINILTDVVIWLLPVPMIVNARLSRREKLGLLWVFLIGGIAVGASIVRPVYLHDIMEDGDPTWNMVNVSVWAMVETSVGILCTSIPVIKPLLLRMAPRLLLSTGERSGHRGGDTYPRDASHARRNSFALHAIKVTHELHQTEDNITDSNSIRAYGLQEPNVTLGFENYEKRRESNGPTGSDENLVVPLAESMGSSIKEEPLPNDKKPAPSI